MWAARARLDLRRGVSPHLRSVPARPGYVQGRILEGKDGRRLRRIVGNARKEVIQLLGQNVYLDLRIKVLKNWQSDPKSLGRLGF